MDSSSRRDQRDDIAPTGCRSGRRSARRSDREAAPDKAETVMSAAVDAVLGAIDTAGVAAADVPVYEAPHNISAEGRTAAAGWPASSCSPRWREGAHAGSASRRS
jgi:hypothetical protein